MKQEGLERYQDLDRRIGAGVAPAATPENSSAGGAQVLPPVVLRLGRSCQPTPAASSEPGDPAKEKLYYDAAFDLIKAKDFDKASQAFTAFLRKYPNSQYAGNAQYWLGEVNLARVICRVPARHLPRSASCTPSTPRCRIRCTSWLT
jgi:TolA-binding protein